MCICLRPGTLTDEPAGNIELGKTAHVKGNAARATVAATADALLASDIANSAWLDLLNGSEDVDKAVHQCVTARVDAAEGEEIFAKE